MMVDKIFKIGILVLVAVFLFLYSQNVERDRYSLAEDILVGAFDTKTGKLYFHNGGVVDYVKGKIISPKAEPVDLLAKPTEPKKESD